MNVFLEGDRVTVSNPDDLNYGHHGTVDFCSVGMSGKTIVYVTLDSFPDLRPVYLTDELEPGEIIYA